MRRAEGRPVLSEVKRALLELRLRERGASPRPSLVPLSPGGTGQPLFLVHPAAGSVFCYLGLAACPGWARPLHGLQAAGIEGEATPSDRLEEIAAQHLDTVLETQPRGPYFLAGWSMGGAVAQELACQLAAAGHEVGLLALMDTEVPPGETAPPRPEIVTRYVAEMAAAINAPPPPTPRAPEAEAVERLLRESALLPEEVTSAQFAARLAVYTATVAAVHTHRPRPHQAPTLLVRTSASTLGDFRWTPFTGSVLLETVVLPGDHHGLLRLPMVERLAQVLQARLPAP